jgi:hypothetical protein
MADRKISDLTTLTTPASGDYLPIVDISETAASSKNKRITIEELMRGAPDGTAAAPGIAFETDPDSGLYSSGANQVSIATNGTERLRIDATGQIEAVSLGTAAAPAYTWTGDPNTGIYSPGADQVAISTNGTGRLYIAADGKIGVGTASPDVFSRGDVSILGIASTGSASVAINAGSGNSAFLQLGANGSRIFQIQATATETYLQNAGATPIVFATSFNERMRLTSDGRLGLGTSSPANPFLPARYTTVGKTLNFGQASNAGGGTHAITPVSDGFANDLYISSRNSLSFGVDTTSVATTEAVRITSAGRVGIGTTSPNESLEVAGNIHVSGADRSIFNRSNNALTFGTNNAERARIDSSGRLLVGTSSSRSVGNASGFASSVQVETTSYAGLNLVQNSNDGTGVLLALGKSRGTTIGSNTVVQSGDTLGEIRFSGSDGSGIASVFAVVAAQVDATPSVNDYPGRLVFSTTADGASSPTERMRINASGRVFIGKTADDDSVGITAATLGNIYIVRDGGAALGLNRLTSDGTIAGFSRSNTTVGTISVTTTATAYNTSSDYRLKENVVPLTGAIDRLSDLQVHRFNFIADPTKTVDGFIAHEAQAVVPECVTGTKDEVDDDGNPVYQGIDQSKLVPLLTAALQEALAEIESLKARVTALEP